MIKWKETYSVGYELFDEQHKELIRLINKVEKLLKDKDIDEDSLFDNINGVFTEILDYTVYHFKSEEDVFKEKGYKNQKEHEESHKIFVENVLDLVGTFDTESETRDIAFKIYNTLVEWLIKHILGEDKLYMKELD
ncbi:bacteriohemerythrin [Helicovermis profundi]|uniref:Bacteriohemerythrin n=1 Tax=Helicovermis profundi TaxID=3065157 RepID=A0AAU9E431_9FIRM|nr:bacteriohemerythrin [Clostridia bacterium S502]